MNWLDNCYIQQYHFQGSLITEQNIDKINPFFFAPVHYPCAQHASVQMLHSTQTPPQTVLYIQYIMSPHTRYVALFTWYLLQYITRHFTFYIYIHVTLKDRKRSLSGKNDHNAFWH
jgi:hypothetical protein